MFIEEFDIAIIDPLCNLLAHLMRAPSLNHVEASPPVLCFCARRRADEEVVFEFALQTVLFDVVGEGRGDFSDVC